MELDCGMFDVTYVTNLIFCSMDAQELPLCLVVNNGQAHDQSPVQQSTRFLCLLLV
jgi:hypothetical protein